MDLTCIYSESKVNGSLLFLELLNPTFSQGPQVCLRVGGAPISGPSPQRRRPARVARLPSRVLVTERRALHGNARQSPGRRMPLVAVLSLGSLGCSRRTGTALGAGRHCVTNSVTAEVRAPCRAPVQTARGLPSTRGAFATAQLRGSAVSTTSRALWKHACRFPPPRRAEKQIRVGLFMDGR